MSVVKLLPPATDAVYIARKRDPYNMYMYVVNEDTEEKGHGARSWDLSLKRGKGALLQVNSLSRPPRPQSEKLVS